jgi:hypothetical protein
MASVNTALASASDEQGIRAVVREYGAAWNRRDMATLVDVFRT